MPMKNLEESIGFTPHGEIPLARARLLEFANLKLASKGFVVPTIQEAHDSPLLYFGRSLLANFEEKFRLFGDTLSPVDQAIHEFLLDYLGDEVDGVFQPDDKLVPSGALILERHGLARELSLPPDSDAFVSPILSSYRVEQGVCHNPARDRRTTEGVFHIVEGPLRIPEDKRAVPKGVFARLLWHALHPPGDHLCLPYTANLPGPDQARTFVSLLLRPLVCPEVPGIMARRTMETRFFAPGVLVSNLDFVESIFGNAGDPYLPENDARLDAGRWSGHTGCVILAPHLPSLRKIDLGLPHVEDASDRQKRDGMCWETEDELYNGGQAFKVACRDNRGVMVTLIADSYYGYCKKEVKTQISFAANLGGLCEEEHAGGALTFPAADLGEHFSLSGFDRPVDHKWEETVARHGHLMDLHPEGYGIDRIHPDIVYLPETAEMDLREQNITWPGVAGETVKLKMKSGHTYVLPSGYKINMMQSVRGQRWRLAGTQAEGTFCHKPCTVSGGGKSEISKSLADAMISGPVIVRDIAEDARLAEALINRDYGDRFKVPPPATGRPSRPLLSQERSFGSVVRMLTPSEQFTDAYNGWLAGIPDHVRTFVLSIKRSYRPEWGDDWKSRFSVDTIDGFPGFELKLHNQKLITRYLRVGFCEDGSWRVFSLRKDFSPAEKLQREDDITASVVVSADRLKGLHPGLSARSYKFSENCEYRLFQRPDDAVIRGYDRVTEADFSRGNHFFSNYEPIPRNRAGELVEDVVRFCQFTEPMQELLERLAATTGPDYFVLTAYPRLVDGKPTKNPRYLQTRPDLENPRAEYLARIGARLYRRLEADQPVLFPVNAVLPGRRNNPAEPGSGIRPLAVFGPVHYQELPELFMDFIASLTGKSPSTTGAGSEGALTKGPFNALLPIHDLNNALVSYLLTGAHGFSSAAGHIGRKYRVDHDISLVVPEVWSRMHLREREPAWLIAEGCLERVPDVQTADGRTVAASRLGYRITPLFVERFFGRVFSKPGNVFTEDMLRPELQSLEEYIDGVDHIVEVQQRCAEAYFLDGSIEFAIPPLRALLHVMAEGHWEGHGLDSPEVRGHFTVESMLASEWYRARLEAQRRVDERLWARHIADLEAFLSRRLHLTGSERAALEEKLRCAAAEFAALQGPDAADRYVGTLGADPTLVGEG